MDAANWNEATQKTFDAHWNHMVKHHSEGKVRLVARTNYQIADENTRGYAIYSAPTEQEAREMMQADPCLTDGIMDAELHPLLLFMLGDKFLGH